MMEVELALEAEHSKRAVEVSCASDESIVFV
jgi:hypothetical protein